MLGEEVIGCVSAQTREPCTNYMKIPTQIPIKLVDDKGQDEVARFEAQTRQAR